jgi:hypothetical protein
MQKIKTTENETLIRSWNWAVSQWKKCQADTYMTLIHIQNGHSVWCFMCVVLWHVDVKNKVLWSQVGLLFLFYIYITV